MGREADGPQQASIYPLLYPFEVLKGIVDRARMWSMASFEGSGRLIQHERAVVRVPRRGDLFECTGWNLKDVGQAPWAADVEPFG